MRSLPELDVSAFLDDPHSLASRKLVEELRDACHRPGFCYLVGHGVAPELDREIMGVSETFFDLPEAERHAIAIGNSAHFRGYTILGDERTQGERDWRDQIDFGPEEPALNMVEGDPPWLRLRGPNQWPASLPSMQDTVVAWMRAIDQLGTALMRALALGLGQPIDTFDRAIRPDPYPRLKIIRYPAQRVGAQGATGQGLGLHQDSGLLSFILQDEVGGLQVESDAGLIDVTPRPGAYVMNLGEMLQAATGGYLRATRHRVVSPPAGKQRISIAYFFNPRLDAVFETLTLPAELARRALGSQNADPGDPVFATFGENTLKIRMRAHPDVTKSHYANVVLGAD